MAKKAVILGKLSGVHGLQGWLRIYSYTRPVENIFQYKTWQLQGEHGERLTAKVLSFQQGPKRLMVQLEGVNDRTAAEKLLGSEICVDAKELPELENEYYWRELVGLKVKNTDGKMLGTIEELMETGANDVLLLKDEEGKPQAIPWIPEVIVSVELENNLIIADWEPLI